MSRWNRRRMVSERLEFDSELWVSYRLSAELFPALEEATRRVLTACAVHLGKTYQALVPSRTIASSVHYRVAPPRMYVGPKDFRANFFEVGAKPHAFAAYGTRFKTRMSRKAGTTTLVKKKGGGFQYRAGRRYMAIPVGGETIFRTRVRHPGMKGGRYLRNTGEKSMPVLEEIVARGFGEVFL